MRIRATRSGQPRMSWLARRRAEKIKLGKQQELARLDIQRKQLEVTKELDAYEQQKAVAEAAAVEQVDADGQAKQRAETRIFRARFCVVAMIIAFCGFWEITGQQMFFAAMKNWPADFEYARDLAPFLVPSISWGFGLYAMFNAKRGLPHQKLTTVMWASAILATVMNTWHAFALLKDWGFPVFLGGASIVGPLAFHWYVTQASDESSGKSAVEIAMAVANRIHHPFLSKRANEMWAASLGTVSHTEAWLRVYHQAKGHLPGKVPTDRIVTFRNRWLFRRLFGRVVNPLVAVTIASADQRPASDADQRSTSAAATADQHPHDAIDQRPTSAGVGATDVPNTALISGASSADETALSDEIERWLQAHNSTADHSPKQPLTDGHSRTSAAGSAAPISDSDQRADEPTNSAPEQRPASARKPGKRVRRSARQKTDKTQAITDYFNQRVSDGDQPADIKAPQAAAATGASEQHARAVLADLRKRHTSTQPAATEGDAKPEQGMG